MKARKFIKRDRTTAGRATGTILCRLSLPLLKQQYDWRTTPTNRARAVGLIRKFVNRHLPQNPDLLNDANFIIEAEIRASERRLGRKRLVMWNFGEELAPTFEQASQVWASLEFEEDYFTIEVEF